MNLTICFAILFLLMLMQLLGVHLQVKQYRKTVSKLHKLGHIGIGSNRLKLGAGSIVIIACKDDGIIRAAEEMVGLTIFSHFKEIKNAVGKSIYQLKAEYSAVPAKKQKFYQAHLNALNALEKKLEEDDDDDEDED